MESVKQPWLLRAKNLSLAYDGSPVLTDLDFEVTPGMYLCIVGENGSGKSTLMKAITGNLRPLAGEISLATGTSVGYLPQQSEIQRDFPASVWEVAISGCMGREKRKLAGVIPYPGFGYSREARQRAEEMLLLLGMEKWKKHPYNALSGGQQQRVLLARALCASDNLLLLDEPATGLDPQAAREMYGLVRTLHDNGTTILMVTHDMEAALEESTHILCLCQRHAGKAPSASSPFGNAPFFGPTSRYRLHLSSDACGCCGKEHTKDSPETAAPFLQLPDLTLRHPDKEKGGAEK